jgi:hypothetical protein
MGKKIVVDILAMELENKSPHWLDPSVSGRGKTPAPKIDEAKMAPIRKKNRDRWLAEKRALKASAKP